MSLIRLTNATERKIKSGQGLRPLFTNLLIWTRKNVAKCNNMTLQEQHMRYIQVQQNEAWPFNNVDNVKSTHENLN